MVVFIWHVDHRKVNQSAVPQLKCLNKMKIVWRVVIALRVRFYMNHNASPKTNVPVNYGVKASQQDLQCRKSAIPVLALKDNGFAHKYVLLVPFRQNLKRACRFLVVLGVPQLEIHTTQHLMEDVTISWGNVLIIWSNMRIFQ